MTFRLVLYAPNVHTGGGLVLLQALLAEWPSDGPALTVFLDARARASLPLPLNARVFWVAASVGSRLLAEFRLRQIGQPGDVALCFHGLPPILPSKATVIVFQQNRNYLGLNALSDFALKTKVRLIFERLISRLFRQKVSKYIVQTQTMARELLVWYGDGEKSRRQAVVAVSPFIGDMPIPADRARHSPSWDFVYVADGEAHKNHRTLLSAWQLLAAEGLRPTLALTLSLRDERLRDELELVSRQCGLAITDLGQLSRRQISELYGCARALIFPSISESFGLPLVEATHAGLPILAGEVDYVRDVCEPTETFDPNSAISIARAVKRFLGAREKVVPLKRPGEFWAELLREQNA